MTNSSTVNTATTTSQQGEEAGITLDIFPTINSENSVFLEAGLEVSEFAAAATGNTLPPKTTNSITSSVTIAGDRLYVIGGLTRENKAKVVDKIPLLGDIPLIGELFKYTDEKMERNELLAFITPTVVHNPDENYENFNREDLIRLEEVSRPLAEQLADEEKLNLNISERIAANKNMKKALNTVNEGDVEPPDEGDEETKLDSPPIDLIDE